MVWRASEWMRDAKQGILANADLVQESLTPREERLLRLRLGIGGPGHTLKEVGEQFSVTGVRIRQIEWRALGKLMKAGVLPGPRRGWEHDQ